MTLEFDLDQFTERGRMLLLQRANQWNCSPAEALSRLLDEQAKRAGRKPRGAVIPDEASADADLSHRQVVPATDDERRAA
jgi:hypothetical protein